MQNIRPFQIALLAFFAIMGVVSIILLANFSGFSGTSENIYGDKVVIWGTFKAGTMESLLEDIKRTNDAFAVVSYVEKDPRTFTDELVNAIAEGRGPDAIIMPSEQLVSLRPKLLPVPYATYAERTYRDQFLDGAEIFLRPDGIYAFPIAVDPLVMYWNRDLLSAAGIAQPPATWESLVGSVVPMVTKRDGLRNVLTSTVAFGEYANVMNAKAVLLMLAIQSGSKLVTEEDRGYRVLLDQAATTNARPPMNAALQFYTDFSNANSSLYTWNGSREEDRQAFIGGTLALYFGFASERNDLMLRNPNLNIDMAAVPQGASATVKRDYGTFYGLAILRTSPNPQGAYAAVQTLAADSTAGPFANAFLMAPASRALAAAGSQDPFTQVAITQSLIARSWLDPDPSASDGIMKQMVDDVVSGRQKVAGAVVDAVKRLELAF
jgi:ABC-type glycerol-3-phosphate transport system substrate-binding protein